MTLLKKIFLIPFNIAYKVFPKTTIKILFLLKQGYLLNLKDPKSYNQKLNWIKLYYKNDLYKKCADKFEVRRYINDMGLGYLLPKLYWQGNYPEEIPFDSLPNEYVIKITNGSGNNIFVNNSKETNKTEVIKTLNKWLKSKYIPSYGEWVYEGINPSIIIEEMLIDKDGKTPKDYKFFCFNNYKANNNIPVIAVDTNRFTNHHRYMFDSDWKLLDNVKFGFPNKIYEKIEKPKNFDKMLEYANILSKKFPHVRVDLYNLEGKIYFGELTFFNGAGFDKIKPRSFDYDLGAYFEINNLSARYGGITTKNVK